MPAALSVVRLSTTPIKGLALDHPSSIELTTHGAVGDRQFFLADEEGRIQSCTANAELLPLAASGVRIGAAQAGELAPLGVGAVQLALQPAPALVQLEPAVDVGAGGIDAAQPDGLA